MDLRTEYFTNLQYKVHNLTARVKAFESGEKYVSMKAEFNRLYAQQERVIKELKAEVTAAHNETASVRNAWLQIFDDIDTEHENELKKKVTELGRIEKQLLETQIRLEEEKAKLLEKTRELYQVKTELEEERGKNQKLKAQINRDHENSSIPSSMKPNRKKIENNREKTDKKPGAQPGHEGHSRKKLTPTADPIIIPSPEKYLNNPGFKPTKNMISKQVISLRVSVEVTEYATQEFRNVLTGQRVHADFPPGVVNEVNYDGSVKAFAFLLNNHCCASIDKVTDFISELTDGQLQISKGMVNGLCKEFSEKTQAAQKSAFADIQLSPVVNVDFTGAKVNGKSAQVVVCATPTTVQYFAREHKGHEGIKGTPVEDYQGILVHDHDPTFYNYGSAHQECQDHVLRYLKDSIQNEPNLQWNTQMRELLREMIHCRNELTGEEKFSDNEITDFTNRYKEVLDTARSEYEYEPPNKYYMDGYNLYKRMDKFMDSHLLFLHDMKVPTNNNLSERLLRIFKRKLKQMMTFRSDDSLSYVCNGLSVIAMLRAQGKNLYKSMAEIFA